MASFNKVILMGNLTRDPELRYTPSNVAICKFSIAVNRQYTTASGEKREEVDFIECEMWGRRGEVINQYLRKGNPIFVEGRLRLDRWEDQQGNKKSRLLVTAENFEFIGGGGGGGGGNGGGGSSRGSDEQSGYGGGGGGGGGYEDRSADYNGGGGGGGGGYRNTSSNSGSMSGGGRPAAAGSPAAGGGGHMPIEEDDIPF